MAAITNIIPPLSSSNSTGLPFQEDKKTPISLNKSSKRQQQQVLKIPHDKLNTSSYGTSSIEKRVRDIDPASYRNSSFHNICTSMLANGYHHSFTKFFNLVQQQRQEHEEAGPAAILLSPLIDNREDILEYLQTYLRGSEEASRRGDLEGLYMIQRDMALHFDKTGDKWLSDIFHNQCLTTGSMIKGDNGRKEAEAHFHVALAYENKGDLQASMEHLETFHHMTSRHKWHTETGENLHKISCEHLRRIYTSIAEKMIEDVNGSIEYLQKAYTISKKGKDTYQEGLASHRLGCAYEKINEYDTAIQHHKSFLDRVRYHGDEVSVGRAYEALARCHDSKGDTENAVKCLELFVEVAERSQGNEKMLANACSSAGIMFDSLVSSL
jgi:tetratricopeptide (TPR) repeat protein